ncbi:MAG: hypothetical protein JW913_04265 [Chitinispirillaceae bacterium]|nr:hypothetical protein [Chitinispirillaceae bacterium]
MSDRGFKGKSLPPAGKDHDRLSDRDHSLRPVASGTDKEIDAALSSTRLFANARNRMLISRKLFNLLFRPYRLKLPIEFSAIVMIIFFSVERYHILYERQWKKDGDHPISGVAPEGARGNHSANRIESEQSLTVHAEKRQPDAAVIPYTKKLDKSSSMRRHAENDASALHRETGPSPTSPYRLSETISGKRNRPPAASLPSPHAVARSDVSDIRDEVIHDEIGDLDKTTIFYEPVNNGVVQRTGGRNAGSGIRSSRTSSHDGSDRSSRTDGSDHQPAVSNRIGMISGLAGSFGGRLDKILEHNGDYYKLRIVIPERNVEPFKAALSQKAIVSYAFTAKVSSSDSSIITFEMHVKE